MPSLTISEALGQIQTIDQQIARKQQFIEAYLLRDASIRDPLQRDGGTPAVLAREMQSIEALHERKIAIRRAVQVANERALITHADETRSVADWLVWRREVVARRAGFLHRVRNKIEQARREARTATAQSNQSGSDLVVHLNEKELAAEMEALEERQGYLAGQLSLKNATTAVELHSETWQTGLEGRIAELLPQAGASTPTTGLTVFLDGLLDSTRKINVIKAVRDITSLGVAEAKAFVESAPRSVKENLTRAEAETIRTKLQEAGGRVSIR